MINRISKDLFNGTLLNREHEFFLFPKGPQKFVFSTSTIELSADHQTLTT